MTRLLGIEEERATTKAKCGGLSTAAAECAAFGRDDDFIFVLKDFCLERNVEMTCLI
jgi:hypothetical protein